MKIEQIPCPCQLCGKGNLTQKYEWEDVEYKSQHGKIRHYFSACNVCGAELADASQTLENKREWVRFRKLIDKVPLGTEIAEMRQRLGISQALAGQLFGGGPVAFSKYEHDDFLPDESMANLLYLAIHNPDSIICLAERKGISLPCMHNATSKMHISIELKEGGNMFEINDERIKKISRLSRSQFQHTGKKMYSVKKNVVKAISSYSENKEQSWTLQ